MSHPQPSQHHGAFAEGEPRPERYTGEDQVGHVRPWAWPTPSDMQLGLPRVRRSRSPRCVGAEAVPRTLNHRGS
jgi:hypothetical protein